MNAPFNDRSLALIREALTLQLWESGAVAVNVAKPFKLVSGNFSPIYVNCRLLISFPTFVDLFCTAIRMLCKVEGLSFDAIAGGETAGIPFAAFLARDMGCPMAYVRKAPKSHGTQDQIEGRLAGGSRVLLAEDLVTDAGSKLVFVESLRRAGHSVSDVVVVFDRLQGGADVLAKHGLRLHALSHMRSALDVARATQLLSEQELEDVTAYLDAPNEWHAARSLPYVASR